MVVISDAGERKSTKELCYIQNKIWTKNKQFLVTLPLNSPSVVVISGAENKNKNMKNKISKIAIN